MTDMTTHDAAGLLPCPFCGATRTERPEDDGVGIYASSGEEWPVEYTIWCEPCGAEMKGQDRDALIAAWNTRSQVPPEPVGEDYGPGSPWSEGYNSGFAAGSRAKPSPDLVAQIARLLAADPVCGGRVASGTIEAIAGLCSRNLGEEPTI